MIITPALLASYMYDITDVYAANDPMPPGDLEEYAGLTMQAGRRAAAAGELGALKAAIEYVLGHPDVEARRLVAQVFPYDDDGARALLAFVHGQLWPPAEDGEPPPPLPSRTDVDWRLMPLADWRALPAAERGG